MGFKALTKGLGEPFHMGDRSAWNTGIGAVIQTTP